MTKKNLKFSPKSAFFLLPPIAVAKPRTEEGVRKQPHADLADSADNFDSADSAVCNIKTICNICRISMTKNKSAWPKNLCALIMSSHLRH